MPYGRISQVRFEALAFRRCAFPSPTRFKRWCGIRPAGEWFAHHFVPYPWLRFGMPGFIKPGPRLS